MLVKKNQKTNKENLQRLRELTDLLGKLNPDSTEYKEVVDKIDNLVKEAKITIDKISCPNTKLKCYESLFAGIAVILNGVNNIS